MNLKADSVEGNVLGLTKDFAIVTFQKSYLWRMAFPDDLISLFDLLLVVKIKPASCKCLFDKSFLLS